MPAQKPSLALPHRPGLPRQGPDPASRRPTRLALGLFLGCLLATGVGLTAETPALPPSFVASYAVSARGFPVGSMRRELKLLADQRFRFSSATQSSGLAALFRKERVEELSEGQLSGDSLRPERYTYTRSGGKKPKLVRLEFDWSKHKVSNTVNDHTWSLAIGDEAVDRLVYQVLIMRDLARGAEQLEYTIADGGKLKQYRFRRTAEERLSLPAGDYDTIKLERQHSEGDRSTIIWVAPALNFIPVRVVVTDDDGSTTTVMLEDVSFSPP